LSDAAKAAEEEAPDEKGGAEGVAHSAEGRVDKDSKSKTEKHLDKARKQSINQNTSNEFMLGNINSISPRRARWMSGGSAPGNRADAPNGYGSNPLSKYF
jgi:hypothetical protein